MNSWTNKYFGVSVNFIVADCFTLHALSVACTCFNWNDLSTDLAGLISLAKFGMKDLMNLHLYQKNYTKNVEICIWHAGKMKIPISILKIWFENSKIVTLNGIDQITSFLLHLYLKIPYCTLLIYLCIYSSVVL